MQIDHFPFLPGARAKADSTSKLPGGTDKNVDAVNQLLPDPSVSLELKTAPLMKMRARTT